MIDEGHVALVEEDFDLVSYQTQTALDPSLPLHDYGLTHGSVLKLRLAFLRLNIEQIGSDTQWTRKTSRSATVKELKEIIAVEILDKPKADISIYYLGTKKLGDTQILGDVVKDEHDQLYFSENKSFQNFRPVFYNGESFGYIGVEKSDTRKELKYHAQDQLGVPFSKIHVKLTQPHHWNQLDGYVIELQKGQKTN